MCALTFRIPMIIAFIPTISLPLPADKLPLQAMVASNAALAAFILMLTTGELCKPVAPRFERLMQVKATKVHRLQLSRHSDLPILLLLLLRICRSSCCCCC